MHWIYWVLSIYSITVILTKLSVLLYDNYGPDDLSDTDNIIDAKVFTHQIIAWIPLFNIYISCLLIKDCIIWYIQKKATKKILGKIDTKDNPDLKKSLTEMINKL